MASKPAKNDVILDTLFKGLCDGGSQKLEPQICHAVRMIPVKGGKRHNPQRFALLGSDHFFLDFALGFGFAVLAASLNA